MKVENGILRQNRHAERDPNVTLKFLDGGISFLEELETEDEECKKTDCPDIILFLMK
jgi:hypothetical protein